jgi:hypothetical protein
MLLPPSGARLAMVRGNFGESEPRWPGLRNRGLPREGDAAGGRILIRERHGTFPRQLSGSGLALLSHKFGDLGKSGQTALDHSLEADAKMARNIHRAARDHEHVAVGQSVPKPLWIVAGALAEQVKRPLWPKRFVSRFFQTLDHPIFVLQKAMACRC